VTGESRYMMAPPGIDLAPLHTTIVRLLFLLACADACRADDIASYWQRTLERLGAEPIDVDPDGGGPRG